MQTINKFGGAIFLLFLASSIGHSQSPPGFAPWTFPTKLNSWSFHDATNWTSDSGIAPVSFTNIVGRQKGDISTDYALLVDSTNRAWLSFRIVENGNAATNIALNQGAITLWLTPGWTSTTNGGTGPGDWAELISVGLWTTNASVGYFGLAVDPEGNNIYFTAQDGSGSSATYLSAPISWATNEWHFLGVNYCATNSALYLDGNFVTNGPGISVLPGTNIATGDFFIGSDTNGLGQFHGFFDDLYTFGYHLDAKDIPYIYSSQFYEFFLNPFNAQSYGHENADPGSQYGSNLWIAVPSLSISNDLASLLVMNTSADVLYEIQTKTNLLQPDWKSEAFVYGSEFTNWTAATVASGRSGNLFMRTRSWQESTGTGIPDWWWWQYFGQITNVDAFVSAAGDGFSNMEKFQMGLNPTNFFNTNPPSGFFGAVMGTNAFLAWDPSPGPVLNYVVRRGIYNTNTSDYDYTQYTLSPTNTLFEDVGAITNDNAWFNHYFLKAIYPAGIQTGEEDWYANDYPYSKYWGPPAGPAMPQNVYAYADSTGTNLVITWNPAQGPATNYLIEQGVFNESAWSYDYYPLAYVGTNATSTQFGILTNQQAWNAVYAVTAVYRDGILSLPATSGINAGMTNGLAAPSGFYGYLDSTGTNAYLHWNLSSNATSYIVYGGNWNYGAGIDGGKSFVQLAKVSAGTSSYEIIGAKVGSDFPYSYYTVVAVYSGGVLSQAANPWAIYNGSPAPATLNAWLDTNGTNVLLAWSPLQGATGYIIQQSSFYDYYFSTIAQVSSSTTTYTHTNGFDPLGDYNDEIRYQVMATLPNGATSAPVVAAIGNDPPSPTGLTATVDSTGTNVLLSWTPAYGAVSSYEIERGTFDAGTGAYTFSQIATVGPSTTSYQAMGAVAASHGSSDIYRVKAYYGNGLASLPDVSYFNPSGSAQHAPTSNLSLNANLIRNEQGRWQLMFSGIPSNVQAIAFYWYVYDYDYYDTLNASDPPYTVETDLAVTEITNGVYVLSDYMATNWFPNNSYGKVAMVQPIGKDGSYGKLTQAGFESYDSPVWVDARTYMKQNLIYQLRAASGNQRHNPLWEDNVWWNPYFTSISVPADDTNYVESSIFHVSLMFKGYGGDMNPDYLKMDNVWPITANYELHHNLYDTNDIGPDFSWQPQSGIFSTSYTFNMFFQGNLGVFPVPVLGIPDPYWVPQPVSVSGPSYDPVTGQPINTNWSITIAPDLGVSQCSDSLCFSSGAKNLFGLSFDTALIDQGHSDWDPVSQQVVHTPMITLAPGDSVALTNVTCFFSQNAFPDLRLTNYYFAPVVTSGTALAGEPELLEPYPIPALSGFSNTNRTPLLIASVGTPTVIGGWAKFAIQNGDPAKFAYLGQYFTNCFAVTNGTVTTNTVDILSPYGDFFPTEPGVAALVTMPDLDSGQQGTCAVRVVSLNVDANHDGTMDFKFNGPDFVSQNKPFRFWVNDSADSGDFGGTGIPGQASVGNGSLQINGKWVIHGRRDLVNLFPVYLNVGSLFLSNALGAGISATDTNWQFVLSQADGVLRLAYTDLTPTNYMNFLRDTNVVRDLANAPLITITNAAAGGLPLPQSLLSGIAVSNRGVLLVEAAAPTTQPLVLTIYHGTNQVARAELPLNITAVEQMFRHKSLLLSSDSREQPDRLTDADVPNEPDAIDKNFVLVHGYNVNPYYARGWFSDIYKRLYWAGSHARFYGVSWSGYETQIGTTTPNYQINVLHAFQTGSNLANFIVTLTNAAPTIVAGHSLGNMVCLSALSDWNAPMEKYFMIDAAAPIEAIDPNAGADTNMIHPDWQNPTNAYSSVLYASSWHQLFPTNDARSTLNWNGRLANFGNTTVYNFYSSGEEVLRTFQGAPPANLFSLVYSQIKQYLDDQLGTYVWAWQEKCKGRMAFNSILSSSHGGWEFNSDYDIFPSGLRTHLPANTANDLPWSQLITNAFFDMSYDGALFTSSTTGSTYASSNRNRILSDAIPAVTPAIGANPVPRLVTSERNFDMQALYENGWAAGRPARQAGSAAAGEWHHSDLRVMAYPFTYQFYNQLVTAGDLE